MEQYLKLLKDVIQDGNPREDRTGIGTRSLFGKQVRYDLSKGFPLLTTKKIHLKSVIHELLWFIRGETNVASLNAEGVSIWDEWADENGNLGPIYGKQWRSWISTDGNHVDQLTNTIRSIQNDPWSRRHIISAWNAGDIEKMALAPCHVLFQFYVEKNSKLSCQLYQRSADLFLGVPFNIASYALLTCMIAQVTNLTPGEFIHTFGDLHLYENHISQAKEQLKRPPKELPTLELNSNITSIFDFKSEDIKITNYCPAPHIKAPVAV